MKNKSASFILHHMNEDDNPFGAVSPPIYQTSIFSFASFSDFREALNDEVNHSLYTRGNNPTVMLAEQKLAALEGAERAKLFSSGSSAISHAIMARENMLDNSIVIQYYCD